jgi:proteasome alpha subunit
MEEAILLGIKALYVATEEKLEAKAVEIGVVNKDKKFRKLTAQETKGYVKKVIKK